MLNILGTSPFALPMINQEKSENRKTSFEETLPPCRLYSIPELSELTSLPKILAVRLIP